ncbi:MAG: site-2 protease family protein [Candidatus Bathyarchaeota archaeon]
MSHCSRCGEELLPDSLFCHNCGAPVRVPQSSVFYDVEKIRGFVDRELLVEEAWMENEQLIFSLSPVEQLKLKFSKVIDELKNIGYIGLMRRQHGKIILTISRSPPVRPSRVIWNLILLFATIATTTFVGYQMSIGLVEMGLMKSPWFGALTFSAAIMGILGIHELSHKIMANRCGVAATWPYFIPIPFLIGTFGALIRTKALSPHRDALFDIGAAGPIGGFIALIPVAILGLQWSFVVPLSAVPAGTPYLPLPLLYILLEQFVGHQLSSGEVLLFHPVAFAAWVGMLVTMLNLMPVGALDGGHLTRAILGFRVHHIISFLGVGITFALGWYAMAILMLFLVFSHKEARPLDDVSRVSPWRIWYGVGLFVMLALCAVPAWGLFFS